MPRHRLPGRLLAGALIVWLACDAPETARVELAGEVFDLELALDAPTRFRGLGGRSAVARDGGMLFVYRRAQPLSVVMRDCPIPLDVAFLDARGVVLAVHAMQPEPPRRPDETPLRYEARLPRYESGRPAQFILETVGGRLAELGVRPGDRAQLDAAGLVMRARN